MTVRSGRIKFEDTPTPGARIRTFQLDSGDRVYVPADLCAYLFDRYSPPDTLYFVERGPLGRTEWVGWLSNLKAALFLGEVSTEDIGGFAIPPDPDFPAGWVPVLRGEDHQLVGARIGDLTKVDSRHRREGFSVERWFEYGTRDGLCLTERFDQNHRSVFCVRPSSHSGDHIPECPSCEVVALETKLIYENVGQWK